MPEQLEAWKEKHDNTYIQIPLNNANVSKWRDDPRAIDSADFDPKKLSEQRARNQQLYLDRYERPKALSE